MSTPFSLCRAGAKCLLVVSLIGGWQTAAAQQVAYQQRRQPAALHRERVGGGDANRVRFGLRLGANLANMNFNKGYPKPATSVATTWQPGIMAGGFLRVPIVGNFSWQQEYLFSQMRSKVDATNESYTLNYVSLPILLSYRVLPHLAFVAGPQLDLLIDGKRNLGGVETSITHDTEERSLGATAGAELFATDHLSLQLRYTLGLNHIGIGQRSAVTEFKYESVQLMAGLAF